MEDLEYFEKILKENKIVHLDLPSGSGRTYILNSLYSKLKRNSLFTHYSSHRTPVGEIFFTLLNLVDKKEFFKEKGRSVGPILRRYIHPRFLKFLEPYEPEVVVNLDIEVSQVFEIIETLLKNKNIKYWFIDNWQSYLEYNEFFKILIPLISGRLNIHFFIVGECLPEFPYIFKIDKENCKIPLVDKDFVIKEMSKVFNIDLSKAKSLYKLSKGDWNNAKIIYKNNFRILEDILREKINRLNSSERKALYTLTLIGKTFSTTSIKAVKELYTPLFFFKDFIDSEIIRWEYPLWRFSSNDVLRIIKETIPQSEYYNLYSSFISKLISYNYSDLWGRIAILAERAEDKKRWLYAKLREFRNANNLHEELKIMKEIIKRGEKKDIYLKKMLKILIDTQRFSEALEVLENIENKTLLDMSHIVRCSAYLGEYDHAEKIEKEIVKNLSIRYELPEILSNVSAYYFLKKESKRGLDLLNSYIKEIINLWSSPRYLANYYNSLAILNSMEGKYMDALHFYNLALDYAKKSNDKLVLYKVINNLGDVERYVYGPKSSIKYNLEAYELSKNFSKNLSVISLANVINSKSQFFTLEKIEELSKEMEELLEDINMEYFCYIGYRELGFAYINYHKFEKVERILHYLKKIKTIPECEVLIKILKGYLGENIDLESLEDEILNTKEEQFILLYMRLLLEKGLFSTRIIDKFSSELPFYKFMKGLIKGENLLSLLTYVDSMLERWEFLDALNSYLLFINYLEKLSNKHLSHFLYNSCFEALSLSILLKLDHLAEKIKNKVLSFHDSIINKNIDIKVLENYFQNALINSDDENQVIKLLYRTFSDYLKDFLIKIEIGSKVIKEGNLLLGEENLRFYYQKPPFSISLYSREIPDPYIIFILRSFLKAFIVFWERKYGLYDPLTGLFNRAYGIKRIEEVYLDYKRSMEPFSIIFIDVDSLKKINDTMGHSYGDYVLQEVASSIRSIIRQSDFAIRWGGDEFLVLLRRTRYDEALKVAQRIEEKLKEVSQGKFGISYGIDTISEEITNYEEMIRRADIKMYAEKYDKIERS
ncbi:MAG: diguanylate cyclase [Dictyoglomaceae bacterium]